MNRYPFSRILGIEVPENEVMRIMKNLNFAPSINGDELTIMVTAYREDAERLMKSAGYSFFHSRKADVIVEYFF